MPYMSHNISYRFATCFVIPVIKVFRQLLFLPRFAKYAVVKNSPDYYQAKTVTLIPGDGIGPEIATSVQEIFAAAGVPHILEK